jgi:hypothetical protein
MERYRVCLECKICVEERQTNNIVNNGGKCRECDVDLTHDNINLNHGRICIGCSKTDLNDRMKKISVQCDDCGATYQKRENQSGKAVKELRLCNNLINAVNLPCKGICQETKVVGGITMRCRSKRYTQLRGDKEVIKSNCCGAANKCKSLKKRGDDHWFVCLAVQDDRKTPGSLLMCEETAVAVTSSEIDEKEICQETKVVGGITMRCRSKRYTQRRGDKYVITSRCCGAANKCKSLKKRGDDNWFVCLAVQDDRKTPGSLLMCEETAIASSENVQDDRKMAAV